MNAATVQYETRQAQKDVQYRREYQAWTKSLPLEDRRLLKQKGVAEPLVGYHASESLRDVSERNISYEPAYETFPAPDSQKREYERFSRFVIMVSDSVYPRLECDVVNFIMGNYVRQGISGTEIAAKYGLSRAAFSKRCKQLQEYLHLPPSRGMKSEAACRTYAITNGAQRKWIR